MSDKEDRRLLYEQLKLEFENEDPKTYHLSFSSRDIPHFHLTYGLKSTSFEEAQDEAKKIISQECRRTVPEVMDNVVLVYKIDDYQSAFLREIRPKLKKPKSIEQKPQTKILKKEEYMKVKYGVVAAIPGQDEGTFEVLHFVGFEEKPNSPGDRKKIFKEVKKELQTDKEFGLTERDDWHLREASDEMIEFYVGQVDMENL